jgi:hypothetical protein
LFDGVSEYRKAADGDCEQSKPTSHKHDAQRYTDVYSVYEAWVGTRLVDFAPVCRCDSSAANALMIGAAVRSAKRM